jgi:hypothetical protein
MRFYGAEYNNIELGFASFNIVVLCSIKPHIDLVQVHNMIENGMSRVLLPANRKTVK